MEIITVTVYGVGGYNPDLPNDNILDSYEIEVPIQPVEDDTEQGMST